MKKREKKPKFPIVIRGLLEGLVPDQVNKNGRVYPREVLERMVETINSGTIFMRPEPVRPHNLDLMDIIGHVSKAELTDEGIFVTVTQLDTPGGELMELYSKYQNPPLIATSVGHADENKKIVEARIVSVSPGPFPKPEEETDK